MLCDGLYFVLLIILICLFLLIEVVSGVVIVFCSRWCVEISSSADHYRELLHIPSLRRHSVPQPFTASYLYLYIPCLYVVVLFEHLSIVTAGSDLRRRLWLWAQTSTPGSQDETQDGRRAVTLKDGENP
jgi:hypothetical protein